MAADSPAPQPALRAAARERQVPAPVTGAGVGSRTFPQTARSRGPRRRHRSPAGRSSATCTLPPSPAPRRETAGVHLTPGRHGGAVQLFRTAPAAPLVGTHIDCFPLLPSFKCSKGGGPRGFFFFLRIFVCFFNWGQLAPCQEVRPGEGPGPRTCPVLPSLCLLPPDAQRWGNGPSWRGCWKPRCSSTPL